MLLFFIGDGDGECVFAVVVCAGESGSPFRERERELDRL